MLRSDVTMVKQYEASRRLLVDVMTIDRHVVIAAGHGMRRLLAWAGRDSGGSSTLKKMGC
jgi:hypothetical protein